MGDMAAEPLVGMAERGGILGMDSVPRGRPLPPVLFGDSVDQSLPEDCPLAARGAEIDQSVLESGL